MEKITVKNMDGTMEQVDLVNAFEIEDLKKDFVILSKSESAGEGLTKIYISEIVEDEPGIFKMIGIENDDMWKKVISKMKEIINN